MQINRFRITLHTSKGQFEELVSGESIELGRNISADLPVMASGVSRSHLKVYVLAGKIKLKDLGSTNGTYIKGERIEPHKEIVYEVGSRVSLGQAGCFIRIELAADDVKIENSAIHDRESSYTNTRVPSGRKANSNNQDSSIIENLFGKGKAANDPNDRRLQKRAQAHMEEAEKLVKKRIAEAEASIRKGIQKARIQAKDITSEAVKEADIIKAKAQIEKNNMLSSLEAEISAQKSKVLKEVNEQKILEEQELAIKKSDLESEISLAQGQIKNDIREAEALVNGAKTEVLALEEKRKKLNSEIKDLLEQKNQARQECKEVEVKLETIDEAHQVKSAALESELSFVKKEIDKNKTTLHALIAENEEAEKAHTEKISQSTRKIDELSTKESQLLEKNDQLKTDNEDLNRSIEELNIQLKHKNKKYEDAKTETDRLLHQRDELEDEIFKIKEEEELRIYEYKKQVELEAKKTLNSAQREADLLIQVANTEKENILKKIEENRESENQRMIELKKAADLEAESIKVDAQTRADSMLSKAMAKRDDLLAKTEKRIDEQELKIKEDQNKAANEVKVLKLDAQRRADLLISKARVERENLLKKTEERLDAESLKVKELKDRVELEAKNLVSEAQKRADLLMQSATDEHDELLNLAKRKISEAESKAEEINSAALDYERNTKENVSKLHAEAVEVKMGATKAFEDEKQKVIDQAHAEKKEILASVTKLKEEALLEKENLLKEAKEKFAQADLDYKAKMSEFSEYEKIEKKKLETFLEEQSYIGKNNLEKELAEIQYTRTKEIEEQIRILKTYRSDYAESWSTAIVFKAQELYGSELSEEEALKIREDLKTFSKAVINEENPNEQSEVQNLMKFDPVHREKKKKLFKKQMVFVALSIFALILSPYITKSFKEKAQQVAENSVKATKERVAKFEEEREKLSTFVPEEINEYLETYTKRVLHSPQYVQNELSSEYREEWFLNLDTFFVEELILSDEAIVTFISKETNLIKELKSLRDNINAQFVDQGVERMTIAENKFLQDVKLLLKTEEKFVRFENFKKDYYLKNFPLEVKRSLATEALEKESSD